MMKRALRMFGLILPLAIASTAMAGPDPAADRLFRAKCGACHGPDGKGATPQGQKMKVGDMSSAAWQKKFSDEQIKKTILEGFTREKDGVKQEMKSFKDRVKAEDLDALIARVRAFGK
jgi:mono/diheme cytochrome c family protein